MARKFEFVDHGRTFYCSVEAPLHPGMQPWWWFRLDTEVGTRHAPFEASPNDTQRSVQTRIIAYYSELLAIQARPVHPRPIWRKPAPAPAPPPVEVTAGD